MVYCFCLIFYYLGLYLPILSIDFNSINIISCYPAFFLLFDILIIPWRGQILAFSQRRMSQKFKFINISEYEKIIVKFFLTEGVSKRIQPPYVSYIIGLFEVFQNCR